MKMPTTTNVKVKKEPKAPKSVDTDDVISELEFGDAGKQCVTFLEKKMRNLEKRKKKMEVNRERALKGEKLTKEAEASIEQYDSVAQDLRFAKELHNQFTSINVQHEESVKKTAKKELKRIEEILKLQYTLDQLGGDRVRQDFITGKHGAVVLTQDNLDQLDALYQAISPTRESQEKDDVYAKKLFTAADHLVNFLEGEESQVVGTTYKELRDLVTLINGCGYFERAELVEVQENTRDQEKESSEEIEEPTVELELSEEPEPVIEQTTPEETMEPADNIAQTLEETQTQPLNTLEQDAFFAPSSSPYQPSVENTPFSSQSVNSSDVIAPKQSLPDIQSFTHNRPFQFIQTSYVMPDANSPSVVDPAVIAAQPAGAHGLQFMSPMYDVTSSSVVQQSQQQHQQPQPPQQQPQPPQQQQQQHPSHQPTQAANSLLSSQSQAAPTGVNTLGMPVDLSQAPVDLSQSGVKQQSTAPEYSVQPTFPQPESLFPGQPVGHDEISSTSLPSHTDSRANALREDTISSMNYDIPPSIPMPPSQSQDPTQVEPQEKKSPMNANAPVFQSMYAQGVPNQVNMPPPSANVGVSSDIQVTPVQSEYVNTFGGPSGDFVGSRDFQYQGSNGFPNGNYGRGPGGHRGGFRGPRGGSSAGPNNSMNNRNGGSPLQNGFGPRGSPTNNSNSRGARGGNSYQNYGGPNAGYRSADSFQTTGYGSSSFGNANNYAKRGGMNNNMGLGNSGYPPRPAGMGGNANRGGAMRGGMPQRGPRGAPRGFSRP